MKTRILSNLHSFTKEEIPKKQLPLCHELCHELSISVEQLRKRSKLVLKRILHNYSFFEVSTIDKFNHKIIKTFARDLQLSQNFEVELDTLLILEEAVGRLLERTGNEPELTSVLIDFSLEKIDEDKSWNIAHDLVEIGKLLFQENHAPHIDALRSKSIHDFKEVQKALALQIKKLETNIIEASQQVLQEITNQGFDFTDFPRQTLPNHFKKITEGEFSPKSLYNNKLEENLLNGKILKANDSRDSVFLSEQILKVFSSIKHKIYRRSYLKNSYGNIVPLTVLNEIAKEIKNIELEKDIVPISSMNGILSKEIKNQPVPFIYERMGEKFRHYFIDEFQDTSQMQWENLVPLIGNALEGQNQNNQRGSLFLVGDVKQAIYRWRGGRAEQFLNLLNGKSHPFVIAPSFHSLDTNWRSHDQIVTFNNDFFTTVAPVLQHKDYQNLFLQGSKQKTNNKSGGYVALSFLDKDISDKDDLYCGEVLDTIRSIKSKQYNYSDIAVLVRDNSKGMLVADFLTRNHIPIISSDALLLKNNPKVEFLIALLKVMENTTHREASYQVLLYLAKEEESKHDFISKNLDGPQEFLSSEYGFHINSLKGQSVFNILETAIVQFELANESDAYLTYLMDEVLVFEKRESISIHAFLNYWEQKKETLSIAAPDSLNAVRIMTIHKSKGLEFPFIIFPFANSLLDDKRKKKKSWVPTTAEDQNLGLNEFLLNANKEMLQYNPIAAAIYTEEEEKTVLDSMNVLYVALTRPVLGLFIFSESSKELHSIEQASSYAELFQQFLKEKGIPKNESEVYCFGSFSENSNAPAPEPLENNYISYSTRPADDSSFQISTSSGRLWDDERREAIEMGNLIHFALSKIKITANVPQVVEDLQIAGYFTENSADDIKQKLMEVVTHPKLKTYFSDEYIIYNEQEILTKNGASVRPDRIVISENEAIIIDYKTGSPSPSHKTQIKHYADVLIEMNFKIKHTIIVYIDQKINPVFV